MRIAFLEPHLELYGGIRRILTFADKFSERGEDVAVYHPSGEACSWMRCRAETRPTREIHERTHDVLIFNDATHYRTARRIHARLKVHYILGLYDRQRLLRFDPGMLWPRKGRMLSLRRCLQLPFLHVSNATWMQRWLHDEMNLQTELQLGGIDRNLFHPVPVDRNGKSFRVLCSGDTREFKGTDTVREAIVRVQQKFPQVELTTYHDCGIPQSEMAECYSRADLFVDAQWHAGWNNPVAEAMACGVPVVCSDIGGVQDFASHEETALLAPARDVGAFTGAIERMVGDEQLRLRLSRAALERTMRFDWEASTDRFLAMLYAKLAV